MSRKKKHPVLAIHGSASSGAQWQSLIKELEGERVVLAPDLPGYGKHTICNDITPSQRFDWLGEVMLSLGDKFNLVGHSFGGAVAMRLAEQYPERVDHVVLFEPVTPHDDVRGIHKLKSLWSRMKVAETDNAMDMFCSFWSADGTWAAMSKRAQTRLIDAYETIMLDFEQAFGGHVCLPTNAYKGPLTILRGDASPDVARYMSEQLAASYPQAKVHLLQGIGHFAPVIAPNRVNTAIRAHLGCNKSARRASGA